MPEYVVKERRHVDGQKLMVTYEIMKDNVSLISGMLDGAAALDMCRGLNSGKLRMKWISCHWCGAKYFIDWCVISTDHQPKHCPFCTCTTDQNPEKTNDTNA